MPIFILLLLLMADVVFADGYTDYNSLYYNPSVQVQKYLNEAPTPPPQLPEVSPPPQYYDPPAEPDNTSAITKCWAYTPACESPW